MSTDLSYINSIKDLESAESALLHRIKQREKTLQQQAGELPRKVTQNIARKTLPFLIGAGVGVLGTRLILGAIRHRSTKKSTTNTAIAASPMTVIKKSSFVPLLLPLLGNMVRSWIEKKVQQKRNNNLN